jgi:hypothetical protein
MRPSPVGFFASLGRLTVRALAVVGSLLLAAFSMALGRLYPAPALIMAAVVVVGLLAWRFIPRSAASGVQPRLATAVPAVMRFAAAAGAALGLVALVAGASLLIGGRFITSSTPYGVFVTDKFTGETDFCGASQCRRLYIYDPWASVGAPASTTR